MAHRFRHKHQTRRTYRAVWLFLLPMPLLGAAVIALAKGALLKLVVNSAALAIMLYAAILARKGLAKEAEYNHRKVATAPRYPLKTAAAGLITLATTAVAYFSVDYSLTIAVCFGIGAFVGFYLLYGLDPREEKAAKISHGLTTEDVVHAVDEGRRAIASIEDANTRINNPELSHRLERITELANKILTGIEEEPRDLRRARKFLTVYLDGAKRVTEGYARLHGNGQVGELEDNFRRVLVTIERVFNEQNARLQENNVLDLDVQIEVLKTQLEQEGVV
jgi:5-bromo-4-chloroindolyl phosphate hydrolysis protein